MNGSNPLTPMQAFDPNQDNPLTAQAPTAADAWTANANAYKQWSDAQRQDGINRGLIDPETGWPTPYALVDGVRQWGNALLGSTAAPGEGAALSSNPNFAKWFGASKAVDDAGSPLVLYHGSGAKSISQFKPNFIGSANDGGFYGQGYYFTPDHQLAQDYVPASGGAVHQVHASIQNPFVWDLSTPEAQADTIARVQAIMPQAQVTTTGIRLPDSKGATSKEGPAQWTAALQNAGHDGVFVMGPQNYSAYQSGDYGNVGRQISEAVAFNPTQIKSATSNRGTFNPNDPRIKYGIAGLTAGGAAAAASGDNTQ